MIHFSSVHSIISYSIIFLGNSGHSNTIFKLQKKVIRIMMNAGIRQSCRELFRELNILPLHSQYILSALHFVVKHINMFKLNSTIHSIKTRHCSDLHLPSVHFSKVQKCVYYSGIHVFNYLPARKFKTALKGFLLEGSFYTHQEYFDWELINK